MDDKGERKYMAKLQKKTVEDLNVKGKKVIVRVDFNVPLDKSTNEITDDKRIVGALPTIKYLSEQGARVILVSHLGRPKKGPEAKFSMKPAVERLSELLGKDVTLAADVIGEDAKAKAEALQDGDVMMLENVRFHKEEQKNDPEFARELASLADLYVNDAFGTAHRAHASTAGLANYLPSAIGYLIQKEVEVMGGALDDPKRPFVAILGGAKVSDKIGVIENLLDKVDTLVIGGGMAYTFFAAQGKTVGNSLLEEDKIELASTLMLQAEEKGVKILLPVDTVVTQEFNADASSKVVEGDIEDGWMGMDIGPKSIQEFSDVIKNAGTVVWNGPVGVFEFEAFATGTSSVAQAVADSGSISIIGGGDSAAAMEQLGFADKVTHISTDGGASLEYLEGLVLPGIDCINDANPRRLVAAGNWKMNKGTPADAEAFLTALVPQVKDTDSLVIVGVPYTALAKAVEITGGTNVNVAAQNCHFEDSGAYTGEISAEFLARMEVPYVILGHSERREHFGETNADINKRVKAALSWGRRPILCVGETLEQREADQTNALIKEQLTGGLEGIDEASLAQITVAYEPVWAIGTGKTATDEQAQEVCAYVREVLTELYNEDAATNMKVLYGGSVNPSNVEGLFAQPDVDGGLVGGASLKEADFATIANTVKA